jgi:FlaG/FlaF family flagellin (archaellin)
VSPVIGVVLLVGITVVLAAVVGVAVLGAGERLHQPPSAAVEVTETTFTQSEDCPGPEEVAIDVTLTQFQRATTIYVIADGGQKEVLWAAPGGTDVGVTKRVANEQVGNGGTDIEIGGGGDIAICPGDKETFRFYADYDGQTLLLRKDTSN